MYFIVIMYNYIIILFYVFHCNGAMNLGNTALTYACCGGYEEVVRLLLEASAFVEEQNENGHTPLMEAASGGHIGKGSFGYFHLYPQTLLNSIIMWT